MLILNPILYSYINKDFGYKLRHLEIFNLISLMNRSNYEYEIIKIYLFLTLEKLEFYTFFKKYIK